MQSLKDTGETRLVDMVFPEQTNHYGTLFGGQALALMDKTAFIVASRYARRSVVTASSRQIDFHKPARQGQLVELVGRIEKVGTSSITVNVDLHAEDLHSAERHLCASGSFVLVAVGPEGRPTPIEPREVA